MQLNKAIANVVVTDIFLFSISLYMVMDNSSQRVYFNQNYFFKILRQQAIRQCLEGYPVPFAPISKFHHVRLISPTKKKKKSETETERHCVWKVLMIIPILTQQVYG